MPLPTFQNSLIGTHLIDLVTNDPTQNEVATFGYSNDSGVQIRIYDSNLPSRGGLISYYSSNAIFSLSGVNNIPIKMGINTNNPSSTLHVVGDMNISGTLTTNNLVIQGTSTLTNFGVVGTVTTLSLYQPSGIDGTGISFKNITTNDSISSNCILFTTTLTSGKYLIMLDTPYFNKDPAFSIGTTTATVGLYSATPTTFINGVTPLLQSFDMQVTTTTDLMNIDPIFYLEVSTTTNYVIAVTGSGQTLQFGGNKNSCQTNILTLYGVTNSTDVSTVTEKLQISPIRKNYILSSSTSNFTINLDGIYQLASSSNVEIYKNGFKLAYYSPTSNDYTVSTSYNTSATNTIVTINTNKSLLTNDVIDIAIWPSIINTSTIQNLYNYNNIYFNWSNISSLNVGTNGYVGIGSYNPPQQLSVYGQTAIRGNVGIGTTNPQIYLDELYNQQYSIVTTIPGPIINGITISSSTQTISSRSIKIDLLNNIYVGGGYTGATSLALSNLDGTSSSYSLPTTAANNAFLIKYNSKGFVQGYITFQTTDVSYINMIGIDLTTSSYTNTVYCVGSYISSSTVTFSVAGSFSTSVTLVNSTVQNGFIIKISSTGVIQNAICINTASGGSVTTLSQSITIDSSSGIYVAGQYLSSASAVGLLTFGGISAGVNLPQVSTPDMYLIKYRADGGIQYAISFTLIGSPNIYSLVTDISNNLYITGSYQSSTSVTLKNLGGTSSAYSLPIATTSATFIIYYSSIGTVQGSTTISGSFSSRGQSIIIDTAGNIYTSGYYGNVPSAISLYNLDGTLSSYTLPSCFQYAYIIKYSSARKILSAISIPSSITYASFMTSDLANNLYVIGSYQWTYSSLSLPNLDGSTSTFTLPSTTSQDTPYLIVYSSVGQIIGATAINTISVNSASTACGMDTLGNLYYTGIYTQSTTTIPLYNLNNTLSSYSLPSTSASISFIIKYSTLNGISLVTSDTTPMFISQQSVPNQEYPPASFSNIYMTPDYTDTIPSIDYRSGIRYIYPKYKVIPSYYTTTTTYGLGQYQVWANTIYNYGYSNQLLPSALFNKITTASSNTFWGSFSNGYTSTIDSASQYLPILYAQFPNTIQLSSYSLTAPLNPILTPSKWSLFGSNTRITMNWATLDNQSGQTSWTSYQKRTYTVNSTAAYDFYKLELYRNSTPTANFISLGELQFYGTSTQIESRLIVANNGFVGFGTTNPQVPLDIRGDIQIGGILGDYILRTGPNVTFDGSTTNRDLFIQWMQYVTSKEYRYALQPRTLQSCWWNTNYDATLYDGYTYSTVVGDSNAIKCLGGVLLPDGRVVFAPNGMNTIGIFDPKTNIYTKISTGTTLYTNGGVLLPDGRVIFSPFNTTSITIFNPISNISNTILIGTTVTHAGGVLVPDGRVVFAPFTSAIGIFNYITNTYTTITGGLENGYSGAVLIPDGRVVFVPYKYWSIIGIFNPITNIYTTVVVGPNQIESQYYSGGVLLPDGRVVFVPYGSTSIGVFNPITNTFTTYAGSSTFYAKAGGVLLPDGRVLFVSDGSNTIGFFNPTTNIYTEVSLSRGGYIGGTLLPDGRVILVPSNGATTIGILTPTQQTRPPPIELCYHPCFNKF